MKQNKILIFGAIGVGAYLLLSGKIGGSSGSSGKMFTLPDGRQVPESQLPSLGYVQYQGQWYHQSQLTTANMPQGVDPNSPQWMNYLNTALQTGSQLYTLSSQVASQLSKSIKTTAVDWNNQNITVSVKFGYQVYNDVVNPTTNVTKSYSDQQIIVSGNGQQTKIKLLKSGVLQKEATIDFYGEKLVGFDAGSVGITGVYIGSAYSNIDTVTNMYGIGAVPKKNITYKGYNIRVLTSSGYFETYLPNYTRFVQADTLKGIKEWIKKDIKLEQERYGEIGSVYSYDHPKGLTHCFDGTYSDAHKGACSYHGGAHEIKLKKGGRDYSGKGKYEHYIPYRKAYKNQWAKKNRGSKTDRVVTL